MGRNQNLVGIIYAMFAIILLVIIFISVVLVKRKGVSATTGAERFDVFLPSQETS